MEILEFLISLLSQTAETHKNVGNGVGWLIFTLFKDRVFEMDEPEALIEAYCVQSDFYEKFDFHRPEGDARFERVRFIGARMEDSVLEKCKAEINNYREFDEFDQNGLHWFLQTAAPEAKDGFITKLSELVSRLDQIPRVGLSKATKILHTRYPETIPIIDNQLQKEYKSLRCRWKEKDWRSLFQDYYDNFYVENTYENLCEVHQNVQHLNLTKIRIFDVLWWSYLKSRRLARFVNWKTIRQIG